MIVGLQLVSYTLNNHIVGSIYRNGFIIDLVLSIEVYIYVALSYFYYNYKENNNGNYTKNY